MGTGGGEVGCAAGLLVEIVIDGSLVFWLYGLFVERADSDNNWWL